jgi:methionyl-tRNA synthetase
LLANWGNLVNRTLTNAYRNFGEVPAAGELTAEDRAALAEVDAGFESVGGLIAEARFRAAIAEAMRLSSIGNQYVDHQAPWAVIKEDRERAATILYVALRIVDSLKILFTPFLPFSSQKLHEFLGYGGWLAGPLVFRKVEEEDGEEHTVLTGDYESWVGEWQPSDLPPGQKLGEPEPLFRKLDAGIVEEELRRLEAA